MDPDPDLDSDIVVKTYLRGGIHCPTASSFPFTEHFSGPGRANRCLCLTLEQDVVDLDIWHELVHHDTFQLKFVGQVHRSEVKVTGGKRKLSNCSDGRPWLN